MTRFLKTRFVATVAIAAMAAAACDVHGVSEPGTLATLTISPNPQTLEVNGTQQFTVVGRDFSGAIVTVTPTWSVANGGGAINTSGLFTAGTLAQTFENTVTATSQGISVTATVIVTPGPVAAITVSPTPISLATGATQQYTAVGVDAFGTAVTISPTWSVVAGGGSINLSTGLFTAGTTAGTFTNTVRASVGAVAGFATPTVTSGPLATITVTPNPASMETGASQQFTAVGSDANGNAVAITPAWTVENGGGGINGSGLFTAGSSTGTFTNTVRATSGAIFGSATVNVTPILATITVTPNPANMLTNSTQQFAATGVMAAATLFPSRSSGRW